MTTGKEEAVDQRLDQHSDAMEITLDYIDEMKRKLRVLHRQADLIKSRLRELESIVLPAAGKRGSGRPSETHR